MISRAPGPRPKRSKGVDAPGELAGFAGGGLRPKEQLSYLDLMGSADPKAIHGQNAPHAKRARKPLNPSRIPDQLDLRHRIAEDRQEALLDEGVEETFPASDPVSVKRIT